MVNVLCKFPSVSLGVFFSIIFMTPVTGALSQAGINQGTGGFFALLQV